jgi:uncharacterized protein with HEPN domain
MTRDQPRLADYLVHITEAIERIARYTKRMNEAAFLNNELVHDAVISNLEISILNTVYIGQIPSVKSTHAAISCA